MTMDEFRQLDLKNLPDLPLGPQISSLVVMIAAILGLAYYFVFADLQDQIERQQAKEVQLPTIHRCYNLGYLLSHRDGEWSACRRLKVRA